MKRYEYFNFTVNTTKKEWTIKLDGKRYSYAYDFDMIMEQLGWEGWELLSVVPMVGSEKPFGVEVSLTYTMRMIYYFKREMTEEKEKILQSRQEKKQKIETKKKESIYEIEKLIEFYISEGYQLKFQHKNRIIFGKGIEEVRFDYGSGQWVEKK